MALTGSIRTPLVSGPDGPGNIAAALAYLRSAPAETTAVVINDEAHAARYVRKAHTSLPSAFTSSPHGALGLVSEGRFHPYRPPAPLSRDTVVGLRDHAAPVLMLTASLGEQFAWLPDVMRDYSGLVIEGMGSGHVNQAAARRIVSIAEHTPVVIASRTHAGPILTGTYGYVGAEVYFAGAGAILSRGLDGLRARLLLSLVSGDDLDVTSAAISNWSRGFSSIRRVPGGEERRCFCLVRRRTSVSRRRTG